MIWPSYDIAFYGTGHIGSGMGTHLRKIACLRKLGRKMKRLNLEQIKIFIYQWLQ